MKKNDDRWLKSHTLLQSTVTVQNIKKGFFLFQNRVVFE